MVYFLIGYILRRRRVEWLWTIGTLALAAAVEATAGMELAILIGPGRTPPTSLGVLIAAFLVTTLGATLIGAIGARLGSSVSQTPSNR